jgi:membrane-associated protease RseP (regulator of RpoE activity)
MIVAVMGAVFNVIFAFGLACILFFTGVPVPEGSNTTTVGYVQEQIVTNSNSLAELGLGQTTLGPAFAAGVKSGDKILAVDDQPVKTFGQIGEAILLGNRKNSQGEPACVLSIQRGDERKEITIQPARRELNARSGDRIRVAGIMPKSNVVIDKPMPESPAALAGIVAGDKILKVDGQPINNTTEFQEVLRSGGANERLIEVESTLGENKGTKRIVKLTPQMKTMTNPVAVITYGESNKQSSIVLVPVTSNLLSIDEKNPRNQLMVLSVFPEDNERTDSLKVGTVFDKIDGKELTIIRSLEDLTNATNQGPQNLTFYWKRANGENGSVILKNAEIKQGEPLERALIGAQFLSVPEIAYYNPFEICVRITQQTFTTLGRLFDRSSDIKVNQLASVISISKTYYHISDDIRRVLWFTVLINLNLAVLNLMPIPVLDGGHMLIATLNRFIKGGLNTKAVTIVQFACMAMLFTLMGYIMLNDVRRCSGDNEMQLKQQIINRHLLRPVSFSETK